MFLRICGFQDTGEAAAAEKAGATAVGMLVGLTHEAEDKIDEVRAKTITHDLGGRIEAVMVTHLLDETAIAELATFIGVSTVEVHDDVPPAAMRNLTALLPHFSSDQSGAREQWRCD